MEDADAIVLLSLRQIGCNIDGSVTTLGQFRTEQIISYCFHAMKVINPEFDIPSGNIMTMPKATLFRLCTNLANAIKKLGYNNDLGYHNFLYPNEADVRNMFLFLIEKLPKTEGDEPGGEIYDESSLYFQMIASLEEAKRGAYWFLPIFQTRYQVPLRERRYRQAFESLTALANDPALRARTRASERAYWMKAKEDAKQKDSLSEAATSLLSTALQGFSSANPLGAAAHIAALSGASGMAGAGAGLTHILGISPTGEAGPGSALGGGGGAFGRTVKFRSDEGEIAAVAAEEAPVEGAAPVKTREQVIQEQQQQVQEAMDRLAESMRQMEDLTHQAEEAEKEVKDSQGDVDALEKKVAVKERIAAMLPDAEKSLKELQGLSMQSMERIHKLASEWEAHRVPLVEQHRALAEKAAKAKESDANLSTQIDGLRGQIKQLIEEGRARTVQLKSLKEECEKVSKSANRSQYIKRISEIHRNLRRQRIDIDKIGIDTRELLKEINSLTETRDRAFAANDDVIFKAARDPRAKDDFSKNVYKLLIALHKAWEQLLDHRAGLADVTNKAKELENRIHLENQRTAPEALDKLEGDIAAMRQENETLRAQLRQQLRAQRGR